MKDVFLLLGSNMGEKKSLLESATERISKLSSKPIIVSSFYESEPWGFTADEWFLNIAAHIRTDIEPLLLLKCLMEIESVLGRVRETEGERCIGYTSRKIDIDILLYADNIINTKNLQIPHPRLHERNFALIPLAEIAGNYEHPVFKKSIRELLSLSEDKGEVIRCP